MRQNRLSQRLKSKLDSFGFDALIKGVSTIVEETKPEELEALAGVPAVKEEKTASDFELVQEKPGPAPVRSSSASSRMYEAVGLLETIEVAKTAGRPIQPILSDRVRPAVAVRPAAPSAIKTTTFIETAEENPSQEASESKAAMRERDYESQDYESRVSAPEQLCRALEALSGRLTQEAGKMAASLAQGDVQDAGFYLAHINQILELLHTIDVRGDIARQLDVNNAPPPGRAWPRTAWTVVEFAESPFSALLPSNADDNLVRELIYAAWGISFEHK